ncbi:MAG: M13 family metallopeptidase [Gemmatimonadaceae bacterium]
MFLDALTRRIRRTASRRRAHRSAVRPALLIIACSWWPTQSALAQAASQSTTSKLESTVDASIKPGDDFFAYANGAWLKANTIPAGKERWAVRDELNSVVPPRIVKLIDDANVAPRGSNARKVADFRAAYMNDAAIEAQGLAPIKKQLDSIGHLENKATLTRFLGHAMPADVDPLNVGIYQSSHVLGFAVERSIHGEKTYDAFLVQGGLGLGDRDQYVGTDPRLQSLRTKYQDYIGHVLMLAGFDRSAERASAVMALEMALAQTQSTSVVSANDHNADVRWTRADFATKAPGMEWPAFFDAAGLSKQDAFGVWQPGAVTGLAALVASQPLESWKDYLRFHAIDHYADVLPHAFGDAAAALHAIANGQSTQTPRAQRALDATKSALSDAIGRMYVEQYFPANQKARVQAIVGNVSDAFAKRVAAVTWMSPASKAIALIKIKSLYVGVGYPERWQDYSDLIIDPTDALGNVRRINARNTRRALAKIGQPVDFKEWWIAPQSVAGVLVFQLNTYQVAAALLQAPKYDPSASDAATYGAIGAIMGHDFVHYVDLLGADYDTTFAMRRWWTDDDLKNYKAKTEPLVSQFSAYHPYPELGVDGQLTLQENAADLAGLEAALDAYHRSLGAKANDKAYVRQHDREFFIAFAQSYRTMIGESAMRTQLKTNDHAPEMFRVSTVRNLDAWYSAFDVVAGQRLYLAPSARVHIW